MHFEIVRAIQIAIGNVGVQGPRVVPFVRRQVGTGSLEPENTEEVVKRAEAQRKSASPYWREVL